MGGKQVLRRIVVVTVVVAVLGGMLAACVAPPQLHVSDAVSGLSIPWDVQWAPDHTMLFTEREGDVEAVVNGQRRILGHPADVVAASETGMLGLAVDPQFSSNRYVYTCFASTLGGPNDDVRLVRWKVDAGYTTLTDRTDIVTGMPVNANGELGRHSGCRPRFGPDGAIWIGTGDAATGTNPQNLHSLGGKVLRVDRNGDGVSPNPGVVYGFLSGWDRRIYDYGHRNVQGIAFRPSDGMAFGVEQGTDRDDEVNRLLPGANYGWDPVPPGGGAGYDESQPMTDLAKFPNAVPAVWSSGFPTFATSGGTFVTGTQWGNWDGMLIIACLKGSKLFGIRIDETGTKVEAGSTGLADRGRLRTPAVGPDGALYVTTSNGGPADAILRVTATP
jgi:glucose/arabinose dehydrogenase